MSKVLNFDQFIAEKSKETITVTVFGDEYEVPMEIPAIVPVMMARAESTNDPQMASRMTFKAADAMLGVDAVNKMCSKGMSSNDMATLVQMLFEKINGKDDDDDDEVEEISDEDSRKQTGEGKRSKK